ncbi:MAG: hypothetical protein WB992_19760 [Bryobacteraceae bacterium]
MSALPKRPGSSLVADFIDIPANPEAIVLYLGSHHRHKSIEIVLKYVRRAKAFRDNAAAGGL